MATAITPLANITLSSSASTVTFSSISQAYRDLVLVLSPIATSETNLIIRFNSDSGSNYSYVNMNGNQYSGTGSGNGTANAIRTGTWSLIPTSAGFFQKTEIFDYSVTDKHKTVLTRIDRPTISTEAWSHRWASTSAITSIVIAAEGVSLASGTVIALYGVSA